MTTKDLYLARVSTALLDFSCQSGSKRTRCGIAAPKKQGVGVRDSPRRSETRSYPSSTGTFVASHTALESRKLNRVDFRVPGNRANDAPPLMAVSLITGEQYRTVDTLLLLSNPDLFWSMMNIS
jgi:hypothetical protein